MNLVLFDLDGTLIETDSDHAFGQFLVAEGWADGEAWSRRNDEFFAQYQQGRLDLPAYVDFATAAWRRRPLPEALALRDRFMAQVIRPAIRPEARRLLRQHRDAGDLMAIVTATNEFVTRPIAEAFEVPHLIAVELHTGPDGRATGEVRGVPSFREGKVTRVAQWLDGQGLRLADFARVTFYSDSTNDLPLLEQVNDPVATNPTPALEAIARERGWRVLRLFA